MFSCCSCARKFPRSLDFFGRNKRIIDGLSQQCKLCAQEYRQNNKDKRKYFPSCSKETRKQYLQQNKEHINQLRRENYAKQDKTQLIQKRKENYQIHKIEYQQQNANYYQIHKTEINAKHREYRQTHQHSIYLRNRIRRLQLQNNSKITQQQLSALLQQYNHQCYYCKNLVTIGINLHFDHKVPLSKRGPHSLDNLVPACQSCNLKKGTKTAEEFLSQIRNS